MAAAEQPRTGPLLRLADLAPGEGGVIERVEPADGAVGALVAARLGDLGFVPGTPIRVVRRAALGDPTVYALRGYQLALRRSEAARVCVRAIEGAG